MVVEEEEEVVVEGTIALPVGEGGKGGFYAFMMSSKTEERSPLLPWAPEGDGLVGGIRSRYHHLS